MSKDLASTSNLAVVGHVEWVNFLAVDSLPLAGQISRAHLTLEEPGGSGAVIAVHLARLTGRSVTFFTALGRDEIGKKSEERLRELGVDPIVAWRDQPTRKAISLVDRSSDRAITVIGDRLAPVANDPLPWELLAKCNGVFVSATDVGGLRMARSAKVLTTTPRLGLSVLQEATVQVDALIGSHLDPGERVPADALSPRPLVQIFTEGEAGGVILPGGRYDSQPLPGPAVDTYGCGDTFAAGVTAGLAAGWTTADAIKLGAQCGASCATHFGPYP